eukprot:gene24482-10090_t
MAQESISGEMAEHHVSQRVIEIGTMPVTSVRPHNKKGKWTATEEFTLAYRHRSVGNRWAAISAHFPGRSDNDVKNYWNSTLRAKSEARRQSFLWLYASKVPKRPDDSSDRETDFITATHLPSMELAYTDLLPCISHSGSQEVSQRPDNSSARDEAYKETEAITATHLPDIEMMELPGMESAGLLGVENSMESIHEEDSGIEAIMILADECEAALLKERSGAADDEPIPDVDGESI